MRMKTVVKNSFILFMLALIVSYIGKAKGESIVSEDKNGYIYTGHSGLHNNQKDALNEAYLEAIKEAIRHSFGFKQSYIENYLSTTENAEIFGQMNLRTEDIHLNGITPVEEKVTNHKNGLYSAMRKIHYAREQRQIEIDRQKNKSSTPDVFNIVNTQSKISTKLTITTTPSNALVDIISIEGKTKVSSTTNAIFHLSPGKYTIHFHLNHYLPAQSEIIVGPGENNFHFNLKRGLGKVKINTTPKGASMYLNGLPMKESTTELPVGIDYTLTIEHPDFFPETRKFTTWFNNTEEISVNLRPRSGSLTLSTLPIDSTIEIDSKVVGKGRITNLELRPGIYYLKVSKDGHEAFSERITISAHKKLVLPSVVLQKSQPKATNPIVLPKRKTHYFNHQIAYMPISSNQGESFFYHLPVSYNYQLNSFVGLGAELKVYDDTTHLEEDSISEELYSLRTRFTLIRINAFKFSVGGDYNQRRTVIIKNKEERELRNIKSLGATTLLQVPMIQHNKGLINLDLEYRKTSFQHGQSDFINIGVSFEF